MNSRVDVIEALVEAAIDSTKEVSDQLQATNDEVVSAHFTLLRRSIAAGLSLTQNKDRTRNALRSSLFTILADLADDKVN